VSEILAGLVAFFGTCALIAALTDERPLPWEALTAASCSAAVVIFFALRLRP
jgi:hypothetical protein